MNSKKPSRRQAIRQFTAEQVRERYRQDRALQDAKANVLLDAAEELWRIDEQRKKRRADLEAAKAQEAAGRLRREAEAIDAAVAELIDRHAAGEVVTFH
jgi:hypothetical protein